MHRFEILGFFTLLAAVIGLGSLAIVLGLQATDLNTSLVIAENQTPTAYPTAQTPQPTTKSPSSLSPTTHHTPTTSPTTSEPSASPTTIVPTSSPSTATPSASPNTHDSPTSAPTLSPNVMEPLTTATPSMAPSGGLAESGEQDGEDVVGGEGWESALIAVGTLGGVAVALFAANKNKARIIELVASVGGSKSGGIPPGSFIMVTKRATGEIEVVSDVNELGEIVGDEAARVFIRSGILPPGFDITFEPVQDGVGWSI
jgi:hypothetical protein